MRGGCRRRTGTLQETEGTASWGAGCARRPVSRVWALAALCGPSLAPPALSAQAHRQLLRTKTSCSSCGLVFSLLPFPISFPRKGLRCGLLLKGI